MGSIPRKMFQIFPHQVIFNCSELFPEKIRTVCCQNLRVSCVIIIAIHFKFVLISLKLCIWIYFKNFGLIKKCANSDKIVFMMKDRNISSILKYTETFNYVPRLLKL